MAVRCDEGHRGSIETHDRREPRERNGDGAWRRKLYKGKLTYSLENCAFHTINVTSDTRYPPSLRPHHLLFLLTRAYRVLRVFHRVPFFLSPPLATSLISASNKNSLASGATPRLASNITGILNKLKVYFFSPPLPTLPRNLGHCSRRSGFKGGIELLPATLLF